MAPDRKTSRPRSAAKAEPKGAGEAAEKGAALPAFFYRLSPRGQRSYLQSDAIYRFDLAPSPAALELARALIAALEGGELKGIGRCAGTLTAELCRLFGVAPVRVEVRGVRPHNARGELHGIFFGEERPPLIVLWMRTARRHDVVKPKTFFRTLMHELVHYLDYSLLRLPDSFHTTGFFKRESFLVRGLWPQAPRPAPPEGQA